MYLSLGEGEEEEEGATCISKPDFAHWPIWKQRYHMYLFLTGETHKEIKLGIQSRLKNNSTQRKPITTGHKTHHPTKHTGQLSRGHQHDHYSGVFISEGSLWDTMKAGGWAITRQAMICSHQIT